MAAKEKKQKEKKIRQEKRDGKRQEDLLHPESQRHSPSGAGQPSSESPASTTGMLSKMSLAAPSADGSRRAARDDSTFHTSPKSPSAPDFSPEVVRPHRSWRPPTSTSSSIPSAEFSVEIPQRRHGGRSGSAAHSNNPSNAVDHANTAVTSPPEIAIPGRPNPKLPMQLPKIKWSELNRRSKSGGPSGEGSNPKSNTERIADLEEQVSSIEERVSAIERWNANQEELMKGWNERATKTNAELAECQETIRGFLTDFK